MSQQLVIQPDAAAGVDTYIRDQTWADTNYGDAPTEGVGTRQFAKLAFYTRMLLRFDLAALPAGAMVLAASLRLPVTTSALIPGAQFKACRLTRSNWTEFGATWNKYNGSQPWTTPGGDFTAQDQNVVTLGSPPGELEFAALANLAVDAIVHRDRKLELIVVGPESGATDNTLYLNSSDQASAAARPRLVIDYALPQLSLTDHGDGSGATATISGAADGSQNVVRVQGFAGELGGGAWTAAGQRSGNGTLELALTAGHYFACVHSTLGEAQAVSGVTYFAVTDGLESIHARCLAAVQARIRLLALAGVDHARVIVEKVPAGRNLAAGAGLPAIVIAPHRAAMPAAAGTNSLDDVHYDVLVAIFDRDNQEPTLAANLDRHLLWRQQIARAFRNQRLAGVPEVINAEVEPAEGLLEEAWKRELMASAVLLRFTSRESRGFN